MDDIEVKHGPMIPTYFLLQKLQETYAGAEINFVMGSDLLKSLHLWDEAEKLKSEYPFIIFHRGGVGEIESKTLPSKYQLVEKAVFTDISSTMIRNRIIASRVKNPLCKSMGVYGLLTNTVRETIFAEHLYK